MSLVHTPYFDLAPENGHPPLLLMHGFQMSKAIWNDNLNGLSRFSRPIRMDLFGHGESPAPEEARFYAPEYYFACLEQQRQDLGIDQWLVCGHSLGASLALSYALAYPSSVKAVLFTNSRAALSPPEEFAPENRPPDMEMQILSGGVEGLKLLPSHALHMKHVTDNVKQALMADSEILSPRGVARTVFHTSPHVNVRHRLKELACPALLINGRFERRFQPLRTWVAEAVPDLMIKDVDAGHSPNAELPDLFNNIAKEFFTSQ